ncbi:MAG: hypothetical protein KAS16_00095, partial [Thermoplasmata archaeon]|nr:hypothetical protein [Thermoplasmata archaeon]
MNSGRVISVIVVIMMASSSLAMTISSQDAYVPEDNTYTLRLAMQDDIKTLNPLVADDIWTWHVIQWIYDKPVYQDPETKELMPYIAYKSGNSSVLFGFDPQDNWENSSKPEATIYYDFENVRFHDGHQMDIRDILFSYHAAAQHPVWRGDIECLTDNGSFVNGNYSEDNWLDINKTWESQDGMQSTLKFTLQRPYYNFWNITLAPRILPYHIWGNEIASQNVNEAKIWLDPGYTPGSQDSWSFSKARTWDNRDSIGSGPFKFDSWNPGVKSKILTNRDHFYKPGFKHDPDNAKQPIIEAIVFKIYHDWHGVSALKQNDIDMILSPIPPTFVQEIMNEPDLGIKQSAQKGFSYLGYNMRPERRSFGYNEAGEDVEKSLRHAIAHCIDKMTIHSRLLRNFAIVVDGPISCISTWYNDSIPRYAFDPEHAKIILADAGYKLEDGSTGQEAIDNAGSGNWWLNPDGSSIGNAEGGKIEILTPPADYDPVQAQSGLMIAKQMQDIGLYAESIAMDYGTIQNHIDQRDFDMYILDWRIEEDPTEFLYDFFHSNNLDGHNHPGYSNASFDALMDKVRESGNKDERMELIMDAQAAISYDLPYDVLYYRTNIEAYRTDRFTGWVTGPAGSIYHWRSILEMHPPNTKWLSARFVNTPSAIRSSSSVDISVKITSTIKYPDGTFQNELVPGAFVKLAVTNGTLSEYNGTTDAAGIFRTTYTAPYVPPTSEFLRNGSGILLEVCSAELDEYDPAPNKLVLITAYPDEIKFTAISMEADPDVILDNDTAGNPGLANIIITVTDQDKNPVKGADVVIQVDPKEPIVSPEIATT